MLLTLILTTAALSATESKGVEFYDASWDKALKEARRTKKPILVDFFTDW